MKHRSRWMLLFLLYTMALHRFKKLHNHHNHHARSLIEKCENVLGRMRLLWLFFIDFAVKDTPLLSSSITRIFCIGSRIVMRRRQS